MTWIKSFRSIASIVALAMMALILPLSQGALANHGDRTLDAEPETGSRDISDDPENPTQPWIITATLSAAPTFATGAINVDFELESGPNDPDGGASLNTPDQECSIPAGSSSCSISYTGTAPGTDVWRVWIDHDGRNASQGGATEADEAEGRNEMTAPGNPMPPQCPGGNLPNPPEPLGEDCTDVVEVTWTKEQAPPRPSTLDCDDSSGDDRERETNPHAEGPNSNETYTCTVTDQYGNPARDADPNTEGNQAITVKGEIENGVNDPDGGAQPEGGVNDENEGDSKETPDYTCQTPTGSSGNGQCEIEITQAELEKGTAEICFWVGSTEQGNALCADEPTGPSGPDEGGDDLADRVELTWSDSRADGLDLEPEKETLTEGSERAINATIYDQFEVPYQGNTTVYFEFFAGSPNDPKDDGNTPGVPDAECTTDNDTGCTYTYTGANPGRDLICGWVGDAPKMKGSAKNARGTCNDEGRQDEDDDESQTDAPQQGDGIDVVETTFKPSPQATRLDCSPEWGRRLVNDSHRIKCRAMAGNMAVQGAEIDMEIASTGDPDTSKSDKSPDKTCRTNGNGVCMFTHSSDGTGYSFYKAWVDADYDDSTVESDKGEKRKESQDPGDQPEPDTTDMTVAKWGGSDRQVKLRRSESWVQRGDSVDFWATIRADGGPACEDGQTVKLKSRDSRSNGWELRATAKTNRKGRADFGSFPIWRDTKFKAAAPKNSKCDWAKSNVKMVHTK